MSIGKLISELIDLKIQGEPLGSFDADRYHATIAEIEDEIDAAISTSIGRRDV